MKGLIIINALLFTLIGSSLLQAGPAQIKVVNRSNSEIQVNVRKQNGTGYIADLPKNDYFTQEVPPPDYFVEVRAHKEYSLLGRPYKGREYRFNIPQQRLSITVVFNGTNLVELSEHWQDEQPEPIINYFQRLAAQIAAAQYFAKTRTWFNNIWESITTRFTKVANFFKRAAQPNIKIINQCNFPIKFGSVCTPTLLGYDCKFITLEAKKTIAYPFTVFRSYKIHIQRADIPGSMVANRIAAYKNEMTQHPNDELIITVKGLDGDGKWNIEINWQKKEHTQTATSVAQQLTPPTPHVSSRQKELVSWLDILKGKLGNEYKQKAETIGLHYHIKADAPDFKEKFDTLFFTKDSNGKIIKYHQVPIEDAKKQIDETIKILNEYKKQGLIQ